MLDFFKREGPILKSSRKVQAEQWTCTVLEGTGEKSGCKSVNRCFLVFEHVRDMRVDQERVEDKVTPRYLKEDTCSKDVPSKVSGGRQYKEAGRLREISMYLVLE